MSTELFQFQHKYFQMRSPRNGRRENFFLSLSDCLHNIPNVCIFSWLAIHIRYYFVHMLTSFGWIMVLFVCSVHGTIQLRSHNFIRTKLHWNFFTNENMCTSTRSESERGDETIASNNYCLWKLRTFGEFFHHSANIKRTIQHMFAHFCTETLSYGKHDNRRFSLCNYIYTQWPLKFYSISYIFGL